VEREISPTIKKKANLQPRPNNMLTIRIKEIKNDPTAPLTILNKLTKPDILIQIQKDLYSKIKKEPYSKKNIDSFRYVENENWIEHFCIWIHSSNY
jgi:hypothetical protein